MLRAMTRRLPVVLFLAFLCVPAVAWAGEEALDLEGLIGTRWYGVYMLDRKIGYACMTTELSELDGAPVISETVRAPLLMLIGGQRLLVRLEYREVHEADPPYRLIAGEHSERTRQSTSHFRAQREGDEFLVTRVLHGRTTTQRVPASKATLRDRLAVECLVARGAQPGDEVSYLEFDEDELADVERTATLAEVVEEEWGGQLRRVFVVEVHAPDGARTERHLEDGTLIGVSFGKAMTFRLEDEATARKMPTETELFELRRHIPFEAEIRKPEALAELKLAITGMPDGVLPELPTQRVEKREDGTLIVTLTRSAVPDEPSVTDEDRERLAEHLEATDEIQADHERIRSRARRIVRRKRDCLEQARAICRWVHRHVEGTAFSDYETALDVLIHLEGDCTEMTLLFIGLCRAAGLPARRVSGLAYAGPAERAFAMHAWAQVYVGEWVDVDPAFNQFPAAATHITLDTEGDRWFDLLAAFDDIRIELISAE